MVCVPLTVDKGSGILFIFPILTVLIGTQFVLYPWVTALRASHLLNGQVFVSSFHLFNLIPLRLLTHCISKDPARMRPALVPCFSFSDQQPRQGSGQGHGHGSGQLVLSLLWKEPGPCLTLTRTSVPAEAGSQS